MPSFDPPDELVTEDLFALVSWGANGAIAGFALSAVNIGPFERLSRQDAMIAGAGVGVIFVITAILSGRSTEPPYGG